ncbi:protein of unknown function (plasmid) [Azospirillum baldaniorum]|uniref:Transposase n=1 Tax=Azospirillum baldaniorum TaxID=1064539 RepID=A0A9P1JW74_9PROT|nr:protein of unknown function [Azospirillum baldaniorum]
MSFFWLNAWRCITRVFLGLLCRLNQNVIVRRLCNSDELSHGLELLTRWGHGRLW